MKFKKVTALALTSAMLLSCNAFASTPTPDADKGAKGSGNALEMKAEVTAAALKINVDLPTVDDSTLALDIYGGGGAGQIVCKPLLFENKGSVNVKLKLSGYNINDIKADGKNSGITLSKATFDPSKETTATKKVFVGLKATAKDEAANLDIADADKVKAFTYTDVTGGAFGTLATAKYKADDAATVTAVKDCVVGEMDAAVDADDAAITDAKPAIVVKLDGAINPKGAWEAGDTLNVTPVFDLEPVLATASDSTP